MMRCFATGVCRILDDDEKQFLVLQEQGFELFLLMLREAGIDVESRLRSLVRRSRLGRIGEGESSGGFHDLFDVGDRRTFVHVLVLVAEICEHHFCFAAPQLGYSSCDANCAVNQLVLVAFNDAFQV